MEIAATPSLSTKRSFAFNAETGVEESLSQIPQDVADKFFVQSLDLHSKHGFHEPLVTDDLYNSFKKRQMMEKIGDFTGMGSSAKSAVSTARLEVQKALDELHHLTQLTSLLKANQYLTLQTSYRSEAQDRGYGLSVTQCVSQLRSNLAAIKEQVSSRLVHTQKMVAKRNEFAKSLLLAKERWPLAFVDVRTGKAATVSSRPIDLSRDRIVVDCSIRDAAECEYCSSYVSLAVSESGSLVLDPAEIDSAPRSLVLTVTHCAAGTGSRAIVAEVWASDLLKVSCPPAAAVGDVEIGADDLIQRHSERRRHEVLCWEVFQRLSDEGSRAADCWLSASPIYVEDDGSDSGVSDGSGASSVPHVHPQSKAAATAAAAATAMTRSLLEDKLERGVVVTAHSRDSLSLKLSQDLTLTAAMRPVSDSAKSDGASPHKCRWMEHALRCCLADAQQAVLVGRPTTDALTQPPEQRYHEDARIARNAALVAAAAASRKPASTQLLPVRSKQTAQVVAPRSDIRPLLDLVRSGILRYRVRASLVSAASSPAAQCTGRTLAYTVHAGSFAESTSSKSSTSHRSLCAQWRFTVQLGDDDLGQTIVDPASPAGLALLSVPCRAGAGSTVGRSLSYVDMGSDLQQRVVSWALSWHFRTLLHSAAAAVKGAVCIDQITQLSFALRRTESLRPVARVRITLQNCDGGEAGGEVIVDFAVPAGAGAEQFGAALVSLGISAVLSSGPSSFQAVALVPSESVEVQEEWRISAWKTAYNSGEILSALCAAVCC